MTKRNKMYVYYNRQRFTYLSQESRSVYNYVSRIVGSYAIIINILIKYLLLSDLHLSTYKYVRLLLSSLQYIILTLVIDLYAVIGPI